MPRFLIVFAVLAPIALTPAAAQMAVTAPVLETIMQATHIDQVIYYAQMIEQQISAAQNTYNQFQNMIRAEQRAIDNLKGITSVNSFGDFMNWYNRQLYLERQTENRFNAMGIKIGGHTYKVKDIDQIPDAASSTYGLEYWDDFSDKQRRQMWLNLGLTPANYSYVQSWKAKEKEIANILFTNPDTLNDENMEATERMNELRAKAMDPDVGEKGVLQAVFEVLLDTNRAARQANYDAALERQYRVSQDKQSAAPPNPPQLPDIWGRELFGSISEQ